MTARASVALPPQTPQERKIQELGNEVAGLRFKVQGLGREVERLTKKNSDLASDNRQLRLTIAALCERIDAETIESVGICPEHSAPSGDCHWCHECSAHDHAPYCTELAADRADRAHDGRFE